MILRFPNRVIKKQERETNRSFEKRSKLFAVFVFDPQRRVLNHTLQEGMSHAFFLFFLSFEIKHDEQELQEEWQ